MPRGVYKRRKSKGLKAKAKAKKVKRPRWRVDVAAEPFQVTDKIVRGDGKRLFSEKHPTPEEFDVIKWINESDTPKERQLRKAAMHGVLYSGSNMKEDSLLRAAGRIRDQMAEYDANREQLVKEESGSGFNPDVFLNIESRLNANASEKPSNSKSSILTGMPSVTGMGSNPKTLTGQQKVPVLSVVPPASIIAQATAMRYGAYFAPRVDGKRGYGPYNWRDQPIEAHIYIDAAIRHLMQWFDGDDSEIIYDDQGRALDTVSHLAFALATIGILIDARANATLIDDRPTKRSMAASHMLSDHKLARYEK